MKLQAVHLLVILILALLFCSVVSCKLIEGLTNERLSEQKGYTPLPSGSAPPPLNPNDPSGVNTFRFGVGGLENSIGQNYFDLNPQAVPVGASADSLSTDNVARSAAYYPNQGIPASEIPDGQEDLYILKSSVVPPVCPACPQSTECPREKPCPPCPPCARCPEPAFECKKVPNYSVDKHYGSIQGGSLLPMPVLSDFSQFGM